MAGPLPPLTSSRQRFTNPGIPLISEYRGGESDTVREIPPEWRAALDLHVTEQSIPLDQDLFELTDEILASKTERTVTSEKKIRTTRKPSGVFTLLERFTNKDKEFGTRTRTFHFIDDFGSVPTPSATTDVSTRNFGNKHFEEIVEEIPGIFNAESFTVERPVVTPEDFRALLSEHEHCVTEEGTAVEPTLVPGDISRSDTQQDLYLHRECRKFIDFLGLPATIGINTKTNQYKQVVQVLRTLEDDSTTPNVPSALIDVTFTKLGDGSALEVVEAVDEVFNQKSRSIELPDLLPDIFKASLPSYTHEDVISGTSVTDPPVLASGDFFKEEKRETEFTKKVVTRGRAGISLPQSVTAFRRIGGEQFGAEVTKMDGYLAASEPSVETGLDVVSSEVRNLGNSTWFRQTEKLDTAVFWPTLEGQYFDKEMQVNALTEEQTVDPTYTPTAGTYYVEGLKSTDQYHAKRTRLTRQPDAVSLATALVEEIDGPFQFPGLIYAVSGGYYRRQASAQLCQHIIRTWWKHKTSKPTRGLPGSGMDVEVQDIIMDDIIISSLNNVAVLEYSGMCLHDAITTFGTFVYAATVPSVTDYIALIGTEIVVGASIEPTDIPDLWKIQTKSVVAR